MEQIKDLGVVIAEDMDEKFFIELKEKIENDIIAQARNKKISEHMLKLCEAEIK